MPLFSPPPSRPGISFVALIAMAARVFRVYFKCARLKRTPEYAGMQFLGGEKIADLLRGFCPGPLSSPDGEVQVQSSWWPVVQRTRLFAPRHRRTMKVLVRAHQSLGHASRRFPAAVVSSPPGARARARVRDGEVKGKTGLIPNVGRAAATIPCGC